MSLPFHKIDYSTFGGGNWNDQPGALIRRSHQQVEGGFSQIFPVESPNLENMDFVDRAIGKRKGSTLSDDLSTTPGLISGDSIIKIISHVTPGGTAEIRVALSIKGLYTDQSGSWARLKNANSTDFAWPADVSKGSFIFGDGHLFILPDGANVIQVYRSGADLDDQLHNDTTTTTVDADSNSGQVTLSVAATTMFLVGDRVAINLSGAREEFGFVAAILGGVAINLEDNLSNTHTAAQADVVQVRNRYTETFGGADQIVTGDWQNGTYMGFWLHERLCPSIGDAILEFTDIGQPWDRANGGFYQAYANIVAGLSWTPHGVGELNAVGFVSTTAGPEFIGGFDLSDTIKPLGIGGTALNHQCLVALGNWIVYLTAEGGIEGVNFNEVIDLGRRFKALDGATGPLDTFTPTNSKHPTLPFGFYDRTKKQSKWYFPDGGNSTISHAVGLDFFLGEPVAGEALEVWEKRVRCLYDSTKDPANNPWFVSVYQERGAVIGVLATGLTYTLDNGKNDLDTLPILEVHQNPHFDGGFPANEKNWRRASATFLFKGNWNVLLRYYLNRDGSPTGVETSWLQVEDGVAIYDTAVYDTAAYVSGGTARRAAWIEEVSREISFDLRNQQTSEDWVMTNFGLEYQILAIQD